LSRGRAKFTDADLKRYQRVTGAKQIIVDMLPDGTIRLGPAPAPGQLPLESGALDNRPPRVF
jgi:hypothetical protein